MWLEKPKAESPKSESEDPIVAGNRAYQDVQSALVSHGRSPKSSRPSRQAQTTFGWTHSASVSSAVNRLIFESGTFVVSELRKVEGPAHSLSTQERSSRLQAVQTELGSWCTGFPKP